MLPNFLIVGATKSGTTSLYHYLNQHPEVYMGSVKEPFFFSFIGKIPDFKGPFDQRMKREIITSFEEYENLFRGVTSEIAIGECSNSYLYLSESAVNIKKYIPECKIIMILRNPVDRAFSNYMHHVMILQESLSFEEAIEKEEARRQMNWRWTYQYVGQGYYYNQVKRYFDTFGQEKVKVYLFEELKTNPSNLMRRIYKFLEVNEDFSPDCEKIYNSTGKPRIGWLQKFMRESNPIKDLTKPFFPRHFRRKISDLIREKNLKKVSISDETRQHLIDMYREDIIKLQELIKKDLSSWLD